MKKAILGALFAGAMLASCSSDEPIVNPDGNGADGEPRYISVNIMKTPASGTRSLTRAPGDQQPGSDLDGGVTYEEGLDIENEVNKVRFYFFDKDGNAARVKMNSDGGYQSWVDWTKDISIEGSNTPNVEEYLNATIVINSTEDDRMPVSMVAVVNPRDANGNSYTLENGDNPIYNVKYDYNGMPTTGQGFTMSNATYKGADGKKKSEVYVAEHIKNTPGEAMDNPVNIYVERTRAKVRLNCSLTETSEGSKIYATSTADKKQEVTLDRVKKDVYVKFLGWNTTSVTDLSRVFKNINPSWGDIFGSNIPWNWAEYNRSFWGINASGVKHLYGTFNVDVAESDVNKFKAKAKTKFDKSEWVYVNENASDNESGGAPTSPTKVIIAAQLCDAQGNPLEFAEYGSTRCSVNDLKQIFANNCGLWKKITKDGNTDMVKITPDEIEIKTAKEVGKASETVNGRYKVYAQLTTAAEATDWYPNNAQGQTVALGKDKANAALIQLGAAKVWKEGYTYYYFDISHLGTMKGVVRNHIYDANINFLSGLGTPVYKPEEVIYPEHPDDDKDTYIAARINILSWRVVANDERLEW